MLELSYKTKGNAQPKGKPRVFFTCHPADMERSLDRLCSDLFQAQDCAVYYTEDMAELIGDEDRALQLEQMNLFVVPVSLKLLIEPNRAIDSDVPFARDKHIPILPIMLEPGLDVVYSREDKFGPLQYLDPDAHDITAISYEDKLKKYLSSVLIDDETAERVRKAFDAYIFLSYRKKDRKYANELMRLIHADPQCRDIAIWYDEYLTPGESFSDAIQAALDKSELFTLLVTPNLVNEENYIQTTEYPAARQSGKPILPVEMAETNRKVLESHYRDIPQCTAPDDEQFRTRLLDSLRRIALRENDADPTHNYLIGLAYLDGIDVEVDKARGVELITSAAEADLPEAMRKLRKMYREGSGVDLNYREALKWAQRIVDYYTKKNGEENPETLTHINNLAVSCNETGNHQMALELHEKVYKLRCQIFGDESPFSLASLNNLANSYDNLGQHQKALELNEKLYTLNCRILGDEHPDTLTSLNNLSYSYSRLGYRQRTLELKKKTYDQRCRVLGCEHPDTLISLNNLACAYYELKDYQKALELIVKEYILSCRILGKEHPYTLTSFSNIAAIYDNLGNPQKALELKVKAYFRRRCVLGEEHPDTLISLNNLACAYYGQNDYVKSVQLNEHVHMLSRRVLGDDSPFTLTTMDNLANTYDKLKNHQKALKLREKAYTQRYLILGDEHTDTILSLHLLANTYYELGDYQKALKLCEKVYILRSRILGEAHPDALRALTNLIYTHEKLGSISKAQELRAKLDALRAKTKPQESS